MTTATSGITPAMLESAITELSPEFDSHAVILLVAHQNQASYITSLAYYVGSDAPFRQAHAQLGRQIAEICHARGFLQQDHRSNDIFGHANPCAKWTLH